MIEVSLLNIIGAAVVGNMIAHWFSPIQGVKDRVIKLFIRIPLFYQLINSLNCSKCTSLWLSLIIFQDVFAAALASFVGLIINFVIDYIGNWYE